MRWCGGSEAVVGLCVALGMVSCGVASPRCYALKLCGRHLLGCAEIQPPGGHLEPGGGVLRLPVWLSALCRRDPVAQSPHRGADRRGQVAFRSGRAVGQHLRWRCVANPPATQTRARTRTHAPSIDPYTVCLFVPPAAVESTHHPRVASFTRCRRAPTLHSRPPHLLDFGVTHDWAVPPGVCMIPPGVLQQRTSLRAA